MEAEVDTLCLLTQTKEGQQFKNKKQPELTENRSVWKSDNQGAKQKPSYRPANGGRGGDGQPGGEDLQRGSGWWSGRSQIRMQINREGQLGSETDPHARAPAGK